MTQGGDILNNIRERIGDADRAILDRLWNEFLETEQGVPRREIHHLLQRPDARECVVKFGEGLIYDAQHNGEPVYRPTLLAALASSKGVECERLLKAFVRLAGRSYREKANVDKLSAGPIKEQLGLSADELRQLCGLLELASLWGGGGDCTGTDWVARLPESIESIAFEEGDIGVLRYFDHLVEQARRQATPMRESERLKAVFGGTPTFSEISPDVSKARQGEAPINFEFVNDSRLRDQLENDWLESNKTRAGEAWKATIILWGGILEGVLLDALTSERESAEVTAALQNAHKDSLDELSLSQLVGTAQKLEIISKSQDNLARAVNDYRNLIHPGRQLRNDTKVSREEADVVESVVRLCIRQVREATRGLKGVKDKRKG